MFEEQSYEAIMERMLERIPDDIDKRENSVIWNALLLQWPNLLNLIYG